LKEFKEDMISKPGSERNRVYQPAVSIALVAALISMFVGRAVAQSAPDFPGKEA
jgi:hypothetical protein